MPSQARSLPLATSEPGDYFEADDQLQSQARSFPLGEACQDIGGAIVVVVAISSEICAPGDGEWLAALCMRCQFVDGEPVRFVVEKQEL